MKRKQKKIKRSERNDIKEEKLQKKKKTLVFFFTNKNNKTATGKSKIYLKFLKLSETIII